MPKFLKSYIEHIGKLSRNARIYLVGAAFLGFAQGCYWGLLNIYFKDAGLDEGLIGTSISLRMLMTALISIPVAKIITRLPIKVILMSAAIIACVARVGIVSFTEPWLIMMFSLLTGFSMAILMLAGPVFFMRNSSKTERVHLFTLGFAMRFGAGAIGVISAGQWMGLLGTWMNQATADRVVLLFFAGFASLAVIPFFLLREEGRPDVEEEARRLWPVKDFRTTVKLCIPEALVGLGAGAFIPFINIYFREVFNKDVKMIGWYFGALMGTNFLVHFAAPGMAKKLGLMRTVVLSQFLSYPFLLIMGFAPMFILTGGFPIVFAAFLVRAALMNTSQPLASNFGLAMVPDYDHPLVNSLRRMSWTSAFALSSLVGGFVLQYRREMCRNGGCAQEDVFIYNIIWCFVMYVASTTVYYLFFRKTPREIGMAEEPEGEPGSVIGD